MNEHKTLRCEVTVAGRNKQQFESETSHIALAAGQRVTLRTPEGPRVYEVMCATWHHEAGLGPGEGHFSLLVQEPSEATPEPERQESGEPTLLEQLLEARGLSARAATDAKACRFRIANLDDGETLEESKLVSRVPAGPFMFEAADGRRFLCRNGVSQHSDDGSHVELECTAREVCS
jgi:hypothetical protein